MASLTAPSARTRDLMTSATPSARCNLEEAVLAAGPGGDAVLTVGGWITDPGPAITSPEGLIRLQGPGGVFTATVRVDQPRPDVAAAFKKPNDAQSGFAGAFLVHKLKLGSYVVTVLRPSASGWIRCDSRQPLVIH
jgi:hypothetical protein